MVLRKFKSKGFRNLKEVELEFSENVNLIIGQNAQGKTNILEAIWLFTGEKSFRLAKSNQLIKFEHQFAECECEFSDKQRDNFSKYKITADGIKLELNYQPIKGSDNSGLCAVVFSPTHLSIIKGGPSERRDFLDMSIGQLKPRYRGVLRQYGSLLKQRNAILKLKLHEMEMEITLDVYDKQLAKIGTVIKKTRESYLKELSPKAVSIFREMNGNGELSLAYQTTVPETEEEYYSSLVENRKKDQAAKMTSIGIHRDDLSIDINGKPSRVFASQGQQRSSILSLKLAETLLFEEFLGEAPILLLDDVLSELDETRRLFLLEKIKGPQIFITACDPPEEFRDKSLRMFHIEDGDSLTLKAND